MSSVIKPIQRSPYDDIPLPPLPPSLNPVMSDLLNLAQEHTKFPIQKIPVVGIGGCPGVGKTTITNLLAQQLKTHGVRCVTIRFDDWTNPAESRQNGYFDLQGVHGFFQSYSQGFDQIKKPVVNEFTDEHSTEIVDLRDVDLILFEGLIAVSRKEPDMNYSQYCDRTIFIEGTPEDITRWKRDRPTSVQRTEQEFADHMKAVFAYHRENIEPFKPNATWLIRKKIDHSYELGSSYEKPV